MLLLAGCPSSQHWGTHERVALGERGAGARRIVALAPDVTEIAFALGCGERIVAVGPSADFPPEARAIPRLDPNDAESILVLAPDLLLATTAGNDPRVVTRLQELGVAVFTADVTSCGSLATTCEALGEVLGESERGARLAAEISRRCELAARSAAALPTARALYVVWWEPLIVAAPGTFHDDLLRLAGLANAAPRGAGRYPRVDPELLLDPRLEVAVTPADVEVVAGLQRLLTSPAYRSLSRPSLRVIRLPADAASRPGPRLPEALEALVAARVCER